MRNLARIGQGMVRFFNRLPTATLWALAVFFALWIFGGNIGLTDDEAYYWVLAQRLDWGYAYHPPMVAWLIALAQKIIGPVTGENSVWVVRFWSAASMAVVFFLGVRWLQLLGVRNRSPELMRAGWVFATIPALTFLSWMMVPDTALFLFWALLFTTTWTWCHENVDSWKLLVTAFFSAAGIILSKYSGVLAVFSAIATVALYAPRGRRGKMLAALALGVGAALVPIVLWNARHEWESLLYQLRDRHRSSDGGTPFSMLRGLRFWAIQLFAVGPVFCALTLVSLRAALRGERFARAIWIWAGPAALVFWVQPFFSEFKPHWALAAWFPIVWLLAADAVTERRYTRWVRWQLGYSLALGVVVLMACYRPIVGMALLQIGPESGDPLLAARRMLLDVTNDLYGWSELPRTMAQVEAARSPSVVFGERPVVVGSRYQTASQAAFALGSSANVTWVPRELKARDEWSATDRVDGFGPTWPALLGGVIYVADNRYDAPPEFKGARCEPLSTHYEYRTLWGESYPAKKIALWRCAPRTLRP